MPSIRERMRNDNPLLKATDPYEIINALMQCEWEAAGSEGEPPPLNVDDLALEYDLIYDWIQSSPSLVQEGGKRIWRSTLGQSRDEYLTDQKMIQCVLDIINAVHNSKNNISESIKTIHEAWKIAREIKDKLTHPLAPTIRAWMKDQNAKTITQEYDHKPPVAIIDRSSMGSIRDVIVPSRTKTNSGDKLGEIKGISAPAPETNQLIIPNCEVESKLPAVLPLEAVSMIEGMETTKRGAVAMPIRLFFESIMSLDPKETQADIRFQLGDLLRYLNPDGKYNRTNHLPYVLRGLHSLYWLRIPYRENPDKPSTEVDWIPILPRTVPNAQSGDDASIILEVKIPPNAKSGMMVEKETLRLTGKQSSAKFNAYLSACWIFDRYGTTQKGIIDPTKPIERRDTDGNLLKGEEEMIFDSRGKPIKNPYHSDAVKQLEREPNPARTRYPILPFDDLIRACFPKGFDLSKRATYLKRALKAWRDLEADGIVRIETHKHGWRILPSESHIGRYRAVGNVY